MNSWMQPCRKIENLKITTEPFKTVNARNGKIARLPRCNEESEDPNPAPSQCVAVSHSDKTVGKAKSSTVAQASNFVKTTADRMAGELGTDG
jgi:hypothetical protein